MAKCVEKVDYSCCVDDWGAAASVHRGIGASRLSRLAFTDPATPRKRYANPTTGSRLAKFLFAILRGTFLGLVKEQLDQMPCLLATTGTGTSHAGYPLPDPHVSAERGF
jgi:hypothetical protein